MTASTPPANGTPRGRRFMTLVAAFGAASLVAVAGSVLLAISVVGSEGVAATVEVVRDLFIILLVMEMLLIGAALTVLLVQVARFANLLHNEVRPILESSTEAVNTVRGTAAFLSQNVVEPVMQVNAVMAGARQAFKLVRDLSFLRDIAAAAAAQAGQGSASPSEGPAPEAS